MDTLFQSKSCLSVIVQLHCSHCYHVLRDGYFVSVRELHISNCSITLLPLLSWLERWILCFSQRAAYQLLFNYLVAIVITSWEMDTLFQSELHISCHCYHVLRDGCLFQSKSCISVIVQLPCSHCYHVLRDGYFVSVKELHINNCSITL